MTRNNVQGLVLSSYKYRRSRHLFFTLPDEAEDARGFLRDLLPFITHGDGAPKDGETKDPGSWLSNVGLTFSGLQRIRCDPELAKRLDISFQEGPAPSALFDIPGSASDREGWWDGQWQTHQIHLYVQLHALDDAVLARATDLVLSLATPRGWVELLPRKLPDHQGSRRLDGAALPRAADDKLAGAKVHFGYRDGLSQPDVAWEAEPAGEQLNKAHFLLGYSSPDIASAPRSGPSADFFRDGTYMVLRWLQQDTVAFEKFLTDAALLLGPGRPLAEAREYIAAKMMGRWRDGTPLTLSPEKPAPALSLMPFKFGEHDADGRRCPFSAHIRVVNPRDQPLSKHEVTGVPRVIRRGMPYGPELPEGQTEDDGIDRGTIGVFLCTNIARQIYTMMHWVSSTDFSPVFEPGNLHDQDSLCGNRQVGRASTVCTIPRAEKDLHVRGLPDFIRTRGTAFFLLPSMSTLRSLAQ